jgi:hypothetical protein
MFFLIFALDAGNLSPKICFAENKTFITEQHLHWWAQIPINDCQSDDQKDV